MVGSTLGGALRSAERDAALLASELERLRGRNRSAALNALAVHARQRLERRHSDSASLLQSATIASLHEAAEARDRQANAEVCSMRLELEGEERRCEQLRAAHWRGR